MRELSLHILDIMQNSVAANASRVIVKVIVDEAANRLTIGVEDNGGGMTPDFVAKVSDPFVTTRTTRRVGLGIPLLMAAAQACGGDLTVRSEIGKGTTVEAWFELRHIDRMPLGNIRSTIVDTIVAYPDISFRYDQVVNGLEFVLDTDEMKANLTGVPINDPLVVEWMNAFMEEGLSEIGEID